MEWIQYGAHASAVGIMGSLALMVVNDRAGLCSAQGLVSKTALGFVGVGFTMFGLASVASIEGTAVTIGGAWLCICGLWLVSESMRKNNVLCGGKASSAKVVYTLMFILSLVNLGILMYLDKKPSKVQGTTGVIEQDPNMNNNYRPKPTPALMNINTALPARVV